MQKLIAEWLYFTIGQGGTLACSEQLLLWSALEDGGVGDVRSRSDGEVGDDEDVRSGGEAVGAAVVDEVGRLQVQVDAVVPGIHDGSRVSTFNVTFNVTIVSQSSQASMASEGNFVSS